MANLDSIVPAELKRLEVTSDSEQLYARDAVGRVISIASENDIAVVGVRFLQILRSGLLPRSASSYEPTFAGDWKEFVRANNALAAEFVEKTAEHPDSGYILRSTSREAFRNPVSDL